MSSTSSIHPVSSCEHITDEEDLPSDLSDVPIERHENSRIIGIFKKIFPRMIFEILFTQNKDKKDPNLQMTIMEFLRDSNG